MAGLDETVEVTLFFDPLRVAQKNAISPDDVTKVISEIGLSLNAVRQPVAAGTVPDNSKKVAVFLETNPTLPIQSEGCLAVDICVRAQDVWTHIGNLQDDIYDPKSSLNSKLASHKLVPFRVYVKESRVSYANANEINKEDLHTRLAAIAAKRVFFELAKQEFATREALAEALLSAEQSKEKLDQMTTMFDEIAATCTDPAQIKKGFELLKATHEAVQKNAQIVSDATAEAIRLHEQKEASKLAAYFCSARSGMASESYHEWARREFVFTYVPKDSLPDSSRSEVKTYLFLSLVKILLSLIKNSPSP